MKKIVCAAALCAMMSGPAFAYCPLDDYACRQIRADEIETDMRAVDAQREKYELNQNAMEDEIRQQRDLDATSRLGLEAAFPDPVVSERATNTLKQIQKSREIQDLQRARHLIAQAGTSCEALGWLQQAFTGPKNLPASPEYNEIVHHKIEVGCNQ